MEVEILNAGKTQIARLIPGQKRITSADDVLDLIMNSRYQGAHGLIIHVESLVPDFFDLKSGLAGEILQKFSTYDLRLAIIGDFREVASGSLRAFIVESNKTGRVIFVSDLQRVLERFA